MAAPPMETGPFVPDLQAPAPLPNWNTAAAVQGPYDGRAKALAPGNSDDLTRVVALPRRPPMDLETANPQIDALVAIMTERLSLGPVSCSCPPGACITTLRKAQAWGLWEASIAGGLLGPIGVGHGKCLNDAEILDYATGRRRHVSELGHLSVATLDKSLMVGEAIAFASGEKSCVTVRLANGTQTVASTDHPYLTARGWVHVQDLRIGHDFIAVATAMPEPAHPTVASDDEVALIPLLLYDGGCSRGMLHFTNMDLSIIAEFQRCSDSVCAGWSEEPSISKARQFSVLRSRAFRNKWDLYGLAKNKRAHASIWGLPREQVALFLNRFWACDGHVSKVGCEITLASEKLLDDVHFLLLRLGVRARKGYTPKRLNGVLFPAWRLSIYGAEALNFLDQVGDVLAKESACKALRAYLNGRRRNTNRDIVPVGRSELAEICAELGIPGRGAPGPRTGRSRTAIRQFFKSTSGQYVSRSKFVQFCRDYKYAGKFTHLATEGIAWERVESVKPAGKLPVWDLSVPGTHNFVANGMVVHNTGLDILLPMVMPRCETAVVLLPPTLQEQLLQMYDLWAQHFRVPSLVIGKTARIVRGSKVPVLHVVPFSSFSRAQSSDLLERIAPDLIIADEAQKLRFPDTATTSRVLRYAKEHPATRFCFYSGTLTNKSIRDYAHLSALALRHGSPLPLDPQIVEEWSGAVDPPKTASMFRAAKGSLVKLCDPPMEDIYSAFRRRLTDTLGVTATRDSAVSIRIDVMERQPPPMPVVLAELIDGVRDGWTRPDGEEFVDILQKEKCARELASGFFYRWRYPRREDPKVIDAWLAARKAWHQELRRKLMPRHEHMDSPLLCAKAAIRYYAGSTPQVLSSEETAEVVTGQRVLQGTLPRWKAETWPEWVRLRDTVHPETEAVWVDEYLARDAAHWATTSKGIVWYEHEAFGRKVAELSGCTMHGGGPDAGTRIGQEDGSRSIIASIKSHGTGRDGLQRLFHTQLVANPPANAEAWEQLMGRTHRPGQRAELVSFLVYRHTEELAEAFDRALEYAKYIQGTTGTLQKLLSAEVSWKLAPKRTREPRAVDLGLVESWIVSGHMRE